MERDLGELAALSARIGGDPALVQGAGGNTSIKRGDTLWVKASGTWLRDAEREPVFVPISLAEARGLCEAGGDDGAWKTLRRLDGSPLAPSIETPLHALLDAAVVVHVHSIRTLAWAVRADAEARLGERLAGLDWALVPYARPGAPLAEAVRTALGRHGPCSVLVLANHGLVLGGASVAEVERLLEDVEQRLAAGLADPAAPPAAGAPPGAPPPGFEWSADPWVGWLAHDAPRLGLAEGGSLYPDHVVFLGPRVRVADRTEDVEGDDAETKLVVVRGAGALVRTDLTPGARALVHCLGRLLAQLRPDAPVRYLSPDDEAELLGWDAEAYRAHLDRMRRDAST